jgi:hypothetical protein
VSPTLNPSALVYKLQTPIVLHKGDTLDVELETPTANFIDDSASPPAPILPNYQLGVSFAGYATIED